MGKSLTKSPLIQIVYFLSFALMLTGCSDMVEIQDRDFVLALGASLKNDKYELTFALPDLSTLTKGGKNDEDKDSSGQTRTYESVSLSEIEDLYNHSSNKRLDFRHLEALILDKSISSSADKLMALLEYAEDNHQISRNVRVFYYDGDVKKLMDSKGKIGGSIGDYLKKLENNNQRRNGLPSVTIGNLKDSFSQNKGLVVPLLELKEDKLEANGAAIFQDSAFVKKLTGEELNIYYVIKGLGKELSFHTKGDLVFKLKEFRSKKQYLYKDNKPSVQLTVTGTADISSELNNNDADMGVKISDYLKDAILSQIDTCFKEDKIDYINLYDGSSIKNRGIWLDYWNRSNDFLNDIVVEVSVDIKNLSSNK